MWVKSEELAPLKIDYTYVAIPSYYDSTAVIENPITDYKAEVKSTSADRMSDKNGNILWFSLGTFTDIEKFSEEARFYSGGNIKYKICVTKDGTGISIIEIDPMRSGLSVSYVGVKEGESASNVEWIGPRIYELGRKWTVPWTKKGGVNGISDWSPTSKLNNVSLTPKAEIEKDKLIYLISLGPITEKDGDLYAGDSKLSKDQIEDLKKFRILHRNHIFAKYQICEGYNEAVETARQLRSSK